MEKEPVLFQTLADYDGRDVVQVYLSAVRAKKQLPSSRCTRVCRELLEKLYGVFGEENVKVVEKSIEKLY